jgi:hypothetical protein
MYFEKYLDSISLSDIVVQSIRAFSACFDSIKSTPQCMSTYLFFLNILLLLFSLASGMSFAYYTHDVKVELI